MKPLISWLNITPEFPLAPRSEPLAIALATFSMVGSVMAATSFAADMMVMVILVPVSPSGTGNTLSSLMYSLFALRLFAAARKASFNFFASI